MTNGNKSHFVPSLCQIRLSANASQEATLRKAYQKVDLSLTSIFISLFVLQATEKIQQGEEL